MFIGEQKVRENFWLKSETYYSLIFKIEKPKRELGDIEEKNRMDVHQKTVH